MTDKDKRPGKPPKPEPFKVQIDKQVYDVFEPAPLARRLLEIAGKTPPERFALYKKGKGGQPERLPLDKPVDLTDPGIERFVTLPLDQTEGLGLRRDFELPEEDRDWLASLGLPFELVQDGNKMCVLISGWPVQPGYNLSVVEVHVRLPTGYPDSQIDMVFFHPPLARSDGREIRATSAMTFDGKQWQQWSRHRTPANPWRPGIDGLATHFGLVEDWLIRALGQG